ncbi:unnamed protein product, partial [Porites evermanni]
FFSLAVYHKISTYEFIVSSREQRSEASDVEAGTDKPSSCKQSNKKMFKNKVKPEEERTENDEPQRIEISDHGASEGSDDTLPNETTVKFINEVSSKAAAKQNRSNVEEDTIKQQDYSTITSPDTAHYSPQGITECASSSEESLKEITPPSTSPRVEVKQPASIITSQLQETISSNQYQSELSFNPGPRRVSMITFNDQVEELVPSSQGKKKKKTKVSEDANTNTLKSGDYELTAVNRENAMLGRILLMLLHQGKRRRRNLKQTPPTANPLLLDAHCHNCHHK